MERPPQSDDETPSARDRRPAPRRLHAFEAAVLRTARDRRLFTTCDHVLVALSGGPDSTALLAALASLRDAGELAGVTAVHVDHRLRPDSAADAEACAALCSTLRVDLRRVAVDVAPGASLQAAARRARYRALREISEREGVRRVATGHTRSDQAETVLHRLLRGAGSRGLAGIPARRGRYVRPLLERSRAEVLAYLGDRRLPWREDPTNASPRFLRNRIRREVLPLLEELAPGVERRLATTAELLREDDRALEARARRCVHAAAPSGGVPTCDVEALSALQPALRRRAVRVLWRAAAGTRRGLAAGHVEAVLRMLRRRGPGSVTLPAGIVARVAYGRLELGEPRSRTAAAAPEPTWIAGPARVSMAGAPDTELELDWRSDAPGPWPLLLRTRRPGDRFRPAGGRGGKKLKAWLIDRKVPRADRDSLLVLVRGEGEVVALPQLGAYAAGMEALHARVLTKPAGGRATALQPAVPPVIKGA